MSVAVFEVSAAEIEQILTRTDPAVVLVPPRVLRRVINQDRGSGALGLQVPPYKTHVIGRDALLRVAGRDELGIAPDRQLPDTLILLPQPDPSRLNTESRSAILVEGWRLLFHARIHLTLAECHLDEAAVRCRISRLGSAVFNEARTVLQQDHFLARNADDRVVYEEFVALFFDLRYFAPHRLPSYFPAIADRDAVEQLLSTDVNAADLFVRTRPEGAPLPATAPPEEETPAEPNRDSDADAALPRRAEAAAARGNDVRCARFLARAGRWAEARTAIDRLASRLRTALHLDEDEAKQWGPALTSLLEPAARSFWPVEARLLYDLQKVCIDNERDIFAVDVVEWVASAGKLPIKRPLRHRPLVNTVKYLRRALHRLNGARLDRKDRHALHHLLREALEQAEKRLRERLGSVIGGALDAVHVEGGNYPERLARDTIIAELLDRIVERGFLTMSDLRDAVARNRLKLPDVASPAEIILGDKLLRANRRLAIDLDGVYRRGEIYMRWLQRLSSIFFGTAFGRFLVLFVILPLAGACVVVKGPQLITEEVEHLGHRFSRLAESNPDHHHGHRSGLSFDQSDILPMTLATLFFLGLLHSPLFRRVLWRGLCAVGRVLRVLFLDWPAFVYRLPSVRGVLESRPFRLSFQFVLKPALWAAPVTLTLWLIGIGPVWTWGGGAAVFALALVMLGTRIGARLEEIATDAFVRAWNLLQVDIFESLFRRVMEFFKWLTESIDRAIYAVDEWLRFRAGDSRLSLWIKPVLGLAWFAISYVVRIVINLFVEPTFNPIKHFPVVTIAAKLLVPLAPTIHEFMVTMLVPVVGRAVGHTLSWVTLGLLPGMAGFFVWELKENWKLYRANQPKTLIPVVVGSHGETVLRLLRPGFHSGTLPKLFAKLRRAERRDKGQRARNRREELHHVEGAVRHFAERHFVAVLRGSHFWKSSRDLHVAAVHGATDLIRIDVAWCREAAGDMEIAIEEQNGWLIAGIARPGWAAELERGERLALVDALAGFYKLAGVDLVREQLAEVLPAGAGWSMGAESLTVWANGTPTDYAIADKAALFWDRIVFSEAPIPWVGWVNAWQCDQDGKPHEPPLLARFRLLP